METRRIRIHRSQTIGTRAVPVHLVSIVGAEYSAIYVKQGDTKIRISPWVADIREIDRLMDSLAFLLKD